MCVCMWVDNVLNCHKCHNTKKMFFFILIWSEIWLYNVLYRLMRFTCNMGKLNVSELMFFFCMISPANAPRPIMHITTCMQQDHLLSFRGPSLVSSGDAVTLWHCECVQLWAQFWLCSSVEALIWWDSGPLWTDMQLLAYWSVFTQRLSSLFCNIFTVVYIHAYSSSHVSSEYHIFFIL